jgi:hypothetical protein
MKKVMIVLMGMLILSFTFIAVQAGEEATGYGKAKAAEASEEGKVIATEATEEGKAIATEQSGH